VKRILWFRRDLRVEDNPLLSQSGEVLPIFIFDTNILTSLDKEDARVSYIFDCVQKLKFELRLHALDLKIYYANPIDVFDSLLEEGFDEVVASGDYDAYARQRDLEVSHKLHFRYLQDTYIFRHDEVLKADATPYLVFTPFYKKARVILEKKNLDLICITEQTLLEYDYSGITSIDAKRNREELSLNIQSIGFRNKETQRQSLELKLELLKQKLNEYKEKRDYFTLDMSSNLSVELRFGVIGVRQLLRFLFENKSLDIEPFIRQLIFRDYYAYLLFHFPYIEKQNYKYAFNGEVNKENLALFCEAKTGVPIVDAGVRELLETGNMHNRVRMIVASFFTKDLLLPWQDGEVFFAKHLLDYDKASNVLSWQWSAGTGVDPQPYFRVFNPYLQSKKFDKDALYIKKFIPELKELDAKHIHDEGYLFLHDILGYPKPILHHKVAAKKAIELFKS
jgi:deoxyribodipyrimidine photo-lyase